MFGVIFALYHYLFLAHYHRVPSNDTVYRTNMIVTTFTCCFRNHSPQRHCNKFQVRGNFVFPAHIAEAATLAAPFCEMHPEWAVHTFDNMKRTQLERSHYSRLSRMAPSVSHEPNHNRCGRETVGPLLKFLS